MASKSERLIVEALGYPDAENLTSVSTSATTASGVLAADTTYRVISTEDCYIKIAENNDAATSSHMLLMGGLPEIFVTTANATVLNVIRKDTDGVIQLTPMLSRGK